ncbi:MAG: CoA transferase, partial [Polyangiaceae bacterium]|nr:CoA transferase [Polyangiaceae bacterium]
LELGSLIAGPYASAVFAQFGAEVIKIEAPGKGDPLRTWRKLHEGTSLWWRSQSRNKKSVALNLQTAEGERIIRDLVRTTDVVIENFRPGTLERWGIGYEALREINPRLVMVRVSGYGQTGPRRDLPGFAAIAEAMGGLRYSTGYPDRPPVRTGFSLGDTLAGLHGAIGALVALHHARATGVGQLVDVALYESVLAVTESMIPEYGHLGFVRERTGASLPGIAPSNTYRCSDGADLVIGANSDAIFKRLMRAIGRDDLAEEPALERTDGRVAHVDRIDEAIEAWTTSRPVAEALAALEAADVPAGRIYSAADVHGDPHVRAREVIERHTLSDGTPIDLVGAVPKLEATPGATKWVGPELGEHTAEVLATLGIDGEQLESLRKQGVVG